MKGLICNAKHTKFSELPEFLGKELGEIHLFYAVLKMVNYI